MSAAIACRSCGAPGLVPVLDLGVTPLANSLPTLEQLGAPEDRFPLALAFCERCSLVQITLSVPPEKLFSDYLYFSSFSDTMLRHARAISERLIEERKLDGRSLVMEIASNDGYLLQYYQRLGVPVLGVEPAENIAKVAEAERNIPTLRAFFGRELAASLRAQGKRADVIHANNVLAHVPDLNGFVAGIADVLAPNGVAVIEAPYLRDMVEKVEFDTIYHEHLCYFSLTALHALFARHGLAIVDVERLAIHGGSLRIFAARASADVETKPAVAATLAEERALGVHEAKYYLSFAARVEALKAALVELLSKLKGEGKRIAAYGAAAKGSTLLNAFGIDGKLLDFVVDRSTYKQGRFMPGVKVPIHAPEMLLEKMPDYVLLLVWNFADEVLAQQAEFRARGGKFILPVPAPRVV